MIDDGGWRMEDGGWRMEKPRRGDIIVEGMRA